MTKIAVNCVLEGHSSAHTFRITPSPSSSMYDLKNLIAGKKSVALGNISPEKMTLWRVFSVSKAREGVIILDEVHYKVKLVAGMGHDVLYYFNGCLNDNDIHVVIQRLH